MNSEIQTIAERTAIRPKRQLRDSRHQDGNKRLLDGPWKGKVTESVCVNITWPMALVTAEGLEVKLIEDMSPTKSLDDLTFILLGYNPNPKIVDIIAYRQGE